MRKYVFGPILSRRLGVSLGIDLVPAKTCPLDCIYCEARATTLLTDKRMEYVPIDEVISELDETLKNDPMPDYITFSGAGEPTLNSGIGKVIKFVKTNYPHCKLCLLTNGLLLGDPVLCKDLLALDLVIPSLDASSEREYQEINRPVKSSTLEKLVKDIAGFSEIYSGRLVVEIFVVPGINDSPESIERFKKLIEKISPDAVQLNSLDRPGVVPDLKTADPETLQRFADVLSQVVEVEIINPIPANSKKNISSELEGELLNIIRHRSQDLQGLSAVTGIPLDELETKLRHLADKKLIFCDDGKYFPAD